MMMISNLARLLIEISHGEEDLPSAINRKIKELKYLEYFLLAAPTQPQPSSSS